MSGQLSFADMHKQIESEFNSGATCIPVNNHQTMMKVNKGYINAHSSEDIN